MAKETKKPDLSIEKIGINPFTEGLEIAITKKSVKVINKFEQLDKREYDLESTPYTKVFEVAQHKKQIIDLPIRCKELYLWLIHSIGKAQDIIWIDKSDYMRKMGIKSVNTYKDAIKVLSDNAYIYPHSSIKNTYWINPHFFFKGSRINKYPRNVVVKSTIEEK
jgi:hypothetical protein